MVSSGSNHVSTRHGQSPPKQDRAHTESLTRQQKQRLPQSVLDSLYGLGEAGPAKALMENFSQFISDRQLNYPRAWLLFIGAKKGGVYGKGVGAIA